MAPVSPLGIDRLIRGDRVQPGADLAARFELVALQMDLEECRLKDVLGHLGITQVMPQIAVQFGSRIGEPTPQTPAGPPPSDRRGECPDPFFRRDRSRGGQAVASCRSCCSSVVRTYREEGSREGGRAHSFNSVGHGRDADRNAGPLRKAILTSRGFSVPEKNQNRREKGTGAFCRNGPWVLRTKGACPLFASRPHNGPRIMQPVCQDRIAENRIPADSRIMP